jgi:sulfide dehydrogenase cytochrome subunit
MKTICVSFASILLVFFATASSAADLAADIQMCEGCHGDQGVSSWNDVPTIAGVDAFFHADALYNYRDEARPCAVSEFRQGDTTMAATTMCAIVADFDDDKLEAIAEHFAALPYVPAQQEVDAALAETGKSVHEKSCGLCHSDGGSNPDDSAGILAGQWMGYLGVAMAEYKSGDREQPAKMQQNIGSLSDDDVAALLHFYANQQ